MLFTAKIFRRMIFKCNVIIHIYRNRGGGNKPAGRASFRAPIKRNYLKKEARETSTSTYHIMHWPGSNLYDYQSVISVVMILPSFGGKEQAFSV